MSTIRFRTGAVTLALMLVSAAASQTMIYVDADASGPTHDGTSWCSAYTGVQEALAAAASDPNIGEIHIAGGVYRPTAQFDPGTPRTETFDLLNGVALRGGYAGCGETDPNERDLELHETTLSGDLLGNDDPNALPQANDPLRSDNAFHVVRSIGTNASAVLDGLTISGGHADSSENGRGGGVVCDDSTVTLTDCTFVWNWARYDGGMHSDSGAPH